MLPCTLSSTLFPYTTLFRSGELLLRSDGAAIRADAHGGGGIEPDEDISRRVADGDGLRLNLGSVDGQGKVLLDVHVNRDGIEGHRQRTAGLENRQMRWTANADLAAFHEVDARGPGFDDHVTAAAEDGFHPAVDD